MSGQSLLECQAPIVAVSRISRRTMAAALTLGGSFAFGDIVKRANNIQIGLTPVLLTSDLQLLGNLREYLSLALDHDVELVTRRTYQEISALLLAGQIDAAWICGYPYVLYRDQLELLAIPVWRGRPLYRSYLIVQAGRSAATFDDLEGDVHAFSDPDSNSGFLVTRDLLADRGVKPETFFRHFFYTYGHRNVVRAVAAGLAQSGSVDGYVWEVLQETEADLTRHTRVLRKSELLGFPPIAASRRRSKPPPNGDLAKAFLQMPRHAEGQRVLAALRLDGFVAGDDALFDTIAAKAEHVRRVG
jgi:phosphonate transport system substrate-binding protein